MRRFFKTVSILLLCGTLCCPVVEGRGRNNGQGGASQSHQSTQQAPQRGQSQGGQRPGGSQGGQHSGDNGGQRPGGSQGGQRPGNNGGQRPGGSQGGQRPGNNSGNRPHSGNAGPQQGHQGNSHGPATPPPGGGHAPNHGHGTPPPPPGGHTPGYGQHPNYGYGAPHRPNLPPPAPWQRPTPPPPGYRPYHGPSISTILGIALGTTLYYALDDLGARGYNVVGYGNDAIYLNNVIQLGMNWPDATLYYVNGRLAASEFVYGQGYYDTSRYYNAYGMLASTYGYPTSTNSYGQGGQQSSWWSPTGQFITLTYAPATDYYGNTRYYTTLSFGN